MPMEPIKSRGDIDVADSLLSTDEETPPTGMCGFLAGFAETLSLFCIVPGFWRLGAYQLIGAAGCALPCIYFVGPIQSQIWGDHASSYSCWANAGQFAVAIFGAPLFGMWSDGRPRKTAMLIVAGCTLIRFVPFVFNIPMKDLPDNPNMWQSGEIGLYTYIVINILTAPFVGQLSGSPVVWAWMTDVIPQEHRETGFSLIFSLCSFGAWIAGTLFTAVVHHLHLAQEAYLYAGVVCLVIALLLIVTSPSAPPPRSAEVNPDPLARQKGLKDLMLSPFRLVARKRSLRLICGVSAFITLPDVAVTYVAQPIVFVVLGIAGNSDEAIKAQSSLCNWFSNFPNVFLFGLFAIVGVFAKRFGPARTIAVWTPITCVLFAGPAMLAVPGLDSPAIEVLSGLMMTSPISLYPPLQALVALLVPPARIGEAMGAVAACKNVASLAAPLMMNAIISVLDHANRQDLYWTVFPGAALFMLVGAWPFTILLQRRMAVGTDTDFKWSFWSEVSMSVSRQSMMGSTISRQAAMSRSRLGGSTVSGVSAVPREAHV